MSEEHNHQSEFIRRRQREREKTFLTRKNLLSLVMVSIVLCAAFVVWAGVPEGGMGLGELAIFAIVMLVGVILAALVGVIILSVLRKLRRGSGGDNLSVLLDDADRNVDDKTE